jgi:anti-anti-sigma factor
MFNISQNNGEVLLSGHFNAAEMEKASLVLNQVNSNCTLNFKDLVYISSAGLGSILNLHVRLKNAGHSITLTNMNKHIREVFKYSGLDKVLTIVE